VKNRQNSTKALVESGVLTTLAIVLILLSIYIPVFLFIGVFIWPIPITYIYAKHGMKYSISSLVVTYIIASITSDPITAFFLVVLYGVLGVVLGYCIKSKKSVSISITILAICGFISTMIILKVLQLVTGQDMITQFVNAIGAMSEELRNSLLKSGMSKEKVKQMMMAFPDPITIKAILPALFMACSFVIAFLCYFITQKILKKIKYNIPEISPLSEWYVPSRVAIGIIIVFLLSIALSYFGVNNGNNYYINATLILNYTFTINGLGFIASFFKKRQVPKYFRWVIITICILTPIASLLFYVGIFDYMLDFRKLDKSRKRPIE
jgi:uncharacterized protein YybS (DUF2232 family)